MNQRELFLRHVAQTSDTPFSGYDMNIVSAKGSKLKDVNDKIYIDLISGISVSSVGHCHPHVVDAIREQTEKYMHLMVFGEYNQTPQVKYADHLCSFLPSALQSVYFTTGGSEAIEGAIKLAKRITGKPQTVSFRNAYHGSTMGALGIIGSEVFKNSFRPLIPGNTIVEYNDPNSLKMIDEHTAAVIVECIQGEAGVVKADMDFLQALQKRCDHVGAMLIVDEIQTGFGRTGTLFAFEQFKIVPDILVIAKGMGGGLPIGAFISSTEKMNALCSDPVLGHMNTFGGNAVCVRAAHATLEVIQSENLISRAKEIETFAVSKLKHPRIKEIRMHGALGAIDFGDESLNMRVIEACIKNGVVTDWFLFCSTAMRIAPPLTITNEELQSAIHTIIKVLDSL